ncbi:MAG: hypothetical protein KF870_07165 [Leadbetterella sp.]|nr:hypothetical protein [Leadbetterella sp.]
MRKSILTLAITLMSVFAYSQDKIYTHKGDFVVCKVTEMGEKSIKYKYEGEELTNSISKNLVSQVKFANGRIQKVSDKVVVSSELDWEKVIITNVESDIEGLTRVGEMMAKASSGWSMTNQGKMEKKAMDKLKKEASSHGCHIVLLLTTTGKGGHYGISGGTKASVTGVAYKY